MRAAPHPTDVLVGQQLRRQRTLLGMSQERLGSLLGVTYQQVQKYERGINRIGSSRLQELARILGVPVSYFFPAEASAGLAASAATPTAEGALVSLAEGPGSSMVDRRETLELVRAFNRIGDPLIRRRMLDLARALATAGHSSHQEGC
ncbi:MAG: helix-turn-helix transcriptional regulator [Geminicoccaceae bacterium]